MSTDIVPRTSFFDDDDVNLVFQFQRPEPKHQKDLNSPQVLSNILLRRINPTEPLQQGFYVLYGRILAFYKMSPTGQPDAVLDLAHSRLHVNPASLTSAYYGFTLTRNGTKYEFFSADEKTVENWTNALKSVCVLTNFHDEYKALKMIGKGSFAKVYLVESKTTGKTFAVKAFTKESVFAANKGNAKPSMLNEIDIMRVLDNENVIKLYEVYETEKSIYLVLELLQGKSLQEILKKGGFKENEPRMMNIISSILEALSYLASKGVMHRDLKPDNILIDKFDKIKIVDFGLATFIDVPEYIFKKCGTPGYIAPEVFKYDQKNSLTAYDGKCDVFSTGCILYFMLFGSPFFDGANASEILKVNRRFTVEFQALANVKNEIKNANSKMSPSALNCLLQLLEFDQKLRPAASQALSHPFLYSVVHQKITGTYDFYQSGGSSPMIYDKRGSFAQEQFISQLKSSTHAGSPTRFMEKDSLYLDVGRPEITGRIDTLTSGSANNSVLLMSRTTSNADTSPLSGSTFSKAASGQKSFRNYTSTADTYAKSPMYRTSQPTDFRDPTKDNALFRLEEVKNDKRPSDFMIGKSDVYQGVTTSTYSSYNPREYTESFHGHHHGHTDTFDLGHIKTQPKPMDPTLNRLSILNPSKGL